MPESAYRFKVGSYECLVFKGGGEPRAISAFLQDAPKDELRQALKEHKLESETVPFSINVLLVKSGDHIVLVDTGLGSSGIVEKLRGEGIDPASVDTVVVTHGHSDHVGGIVDAAGNFAFPNARYVIWKTEYEHWTAPEQLAQAEKNPAIAVWKTLKANRDKVKLIGGSGTEGEEAEIVPGVCALAAPGHTPGHVAVTVESGGDRLLHIVDAAHSVVQLTRTHWSPNFDYDKIMSADTRRKLFERAERDKLLMMAYHFPFPGLGHVTKDADGMKWKAE